MAGIKKSGLGDSPSFSARYMQNKSDVPHVSAIMANGVSKERRVILSDEVDQGKFLDGSGPIYNKIAADNVETANARVVASVGGISKFAQGMGGGGGIFHGAHGDSVKQTPEVYSPLWLNSNMNLPRDRATINAWCRSFFALNPFVHNAISLHSTYPISKLSIKCPNKDIEKFFDDMIEEIDLMNICVQIAQEYWLLGEAFVYAELDEGKGKWSRLHIQNPDFMIVKRTVVASEPIIMLRPDENLKKIIFSNRPTDIEQRKQLNQHIIDSVRRGENIPLDNFHVSHLARRISPYEIRGTGLPVCIFRNLMLYDKLRECYSSDTEVLTNQGFKTIDEITHITSQLSVNHNYVNGAALDDNGNIGGILTLKDNIEIACVNPDTNELEYHKPIELHMSKYTGEMIHFKSRNIDTLVTPNHKMWLQKKNRLSKIPGWSEWKKVPAQEINPKTTYRFSGLVNWKGKSVESVKVLDKEVPIKLYLKFLGYVISEGYLGQNCIDFVQKIDSDCIEDIKKSMKDFASIFDKTIYERECETKDYQLCGFKKQPSNRWNGRINSKDLMNYFIDEVGQVKATSEYKKIPNWVKELNVDLLSVILESLVFGDGSHIKNKNSLAWKYYTVSPQLADDIQEIVYKCNFAPSISTKTLPSGKAEYCISWSNAQDGNFPIINPNKNYPDKIKKIDYDGIVWCFEVPTGLFVTRRNGQLAIHGNSKFAQADNMINPLTIVKIGSVDYKPTYADLEAWRSTFECHDEETEVLTDTGFKKYNEVISYKEENAQLNHIVPMANFKIACFNPNNEQLEYHTPTGASLYNYNGDMYHFANEKIDIKVTPNHKMWVSELEYEYNGHRSKRKTKWGDWKKKESKDLKLTDCSRFRAEVKWDGKDDIEFVDVCGKQVPIELYLEFLGYVLSEGCLYSDGKSQHTVGICQSFPKYQKEMSYCLDKFAQHMGLSYSVSINKRSDKNSMWSDMWIGVMRNKNLYEYFKNEIGDDVGKTKAPYKKVPRWILELSPRLLEIFLKALVDGDGSRYDNPKKLTQRFAYYSTSKQLADDVYEIVYKCGFVPTSSVRDTETYTNRDRERLPLHTVMWSNTNKGQFPLIYKTSRNSRTKEKHNLLNIEKYNGKIWCFEVPTGLFITRRNGKITIQGNSAQYDKDFKIFTHEGVDVTRVGYGQGIFDISGDITQLIKEIYVGLQVPQVMMDGGADTTYANGGVALDVLRQRYMQFRNMMSQWLKTKIFAPISKIQGFYDYSGGEKQLIVPEIDWNHMSLFDAGDYINTLVTLTQGTADQKRASLHTLYRSMGLEWQDETRQIRKEAIQNTIAKKEAAALDALDLNALRTLDDEDEIPEPQGLPAQSEAPVPGESSGAGGGLPDLGLPGGAPPPPPPSAGPAAPPPPPPSSAGGPPPG